MPLSEHDADIISHSIERAAELAGDPTPLVYEKLFTQQPEMKALFVLDLDGNARGHMLSEALNCVFDMLGPRSYAPVLIQCELTNHQGLGVPPRVFATFFEVVTETFRDILGAEWTSETEAAWQALLADLHEVIATHAEKYGMELT
ncbi:hemoglobin-like flavoprotein [Parvibaculum indicum]|uniref:globin n=1 Tax=Parvibaculum indicum TaxID=562969 RepID=UPI0014229E89|nr:globin [Parvibaculum indicum]NIJ41050.1 hemoglobin-like flavoprotein [Parvibaculum indicum]